VHLAEHQEFELIPSDNPCLEAYSLKELLGESVSLQVF